MCGRQKSMLGTIIGITTQHSQSVGGLGIGQTIQSSLKCNFCHST
uniref:Uncharacterized protein n=1 Tax=Phlebotomus papatasi TaxID=29031 RepID=A0A1B0DIV1_PHLPP